jgi:hypothetical protein
MFFDSITFIQNIGDKNKRPCMKNIHKLHFLLISIAIGNFNTYVYGNVGITCLFKNTTGIPLLFKSYRDTNNQPAETVKLGIGQSTKSHIIANKTITYDIQPNINDLNYHSMVEGAYNILYHEPLYKNQFSLRRGSFTNATPKSFDSAIISTGQITNKTAFPVNIIINLKDAGQRYAYVNLTNQANNGPQQDANQSDPAVTKTLLQPNGFYALTDPIRNVIISCGINSYNSGPLSLISIPNQYIIVNYEGSIRVSTD